MSGQVVVNELHVSVYVDYVVYVMCILRESKNLASFTTLLSPRVRHHTMGERRLYFRPRLYRVRESYIFCSTYHWRGEYMCVFPDLVGRNQ